MDEYAAYLYAVKVGDHNILINSNIDYGFFNLCFIF